MCELSDHMASFATANVFLKHVVTEKTKTKSQGSTPIAIMVTSNETKSLALNPY